MNRLLPLALAALLPACLPDGSPLPEGDPGDAPDAALSDATPDAVPDDAPDVRPEPAPPCAGDACAPQITEAAAWAGDDALHVVIAGIDPDADLAQRGARTLDGTLIAGGYGRFAPDMLRFATVRPLDGAPMPEQVELFLEDHAGHVTARVVDVEPLPRRDAYEACDAQRVTDACRAPLACKASVCVPVSAPALYTAELYTTGETIGIAAEYFDTDDDVFGVRAEIEGLGRTVTFGPDAGSRIGRCRSLLEGTLWVDDVPEGARARLVAIDREGLESAPIEAVFGPPRIVDAGARCDRFESRAVCDEGLVCDVQAPSDAEQPRCFEGRAACPAGWPVAALQPGERIDIDWRDYAALETGDAVAAAAEAQFTQGSCFRGVSPVAAYTVVAPSAGIWDVYLQAHGEDTPPAALWARDLCDAPRAGELGCDHDPVTATLALDLAAGEQVTIFVASDRVWEGTPRYQLSISGVAR